MQISDEVINILEYLCQKIGFTIDWTSNNILPYLEQLCAKFIKWEIGTSITWIVLTLAVVLAGVWLQKITEGDELVNILLICIAVAAFIIIGKQIFDIVKCCTFPEKAVYDYIKFAENMK